MSHTKITYKKLRCSIKVNYITITIITGPLLWRRHSAERSSILCLILLIPLAHPVTWDSSHPHLSQVDTELPRVQDPASVLPYYKWNSWSSSSRMTPTSKFWPLLSVAKTSVKCQAQEVPRPLRPMSSACRQALWRVRFSEGCSLSMQYERGKHCDLRILRLPPFLQPSSPGGTCQAIPHRATALLHSRGVLSRLPCEALFSVFPLRVTTSFWGTGRQHSHIQALFLLFAARLSL